MYEAGHRRQALSAVRIAGSSFTTPIEGEARVSNPFEKRTIIYAAAWIVALGLVALDASTWVELDIATIYGLPLVMAAATRNRTCVWILAASLIGASFGIYAWQAPPGPFMLSEPLFVNRVLGAVTLLAIAALLHAWITSANASESQARLLRQQDEKLEAGKASRRLVAVQETERRALANGLHDLVGQKLAALNINLNIVKGKVSQRIDPLLDARLEESLKMVEETIESIRNVMVALRPAVLDDYGLAPGLRWYADQFNKRTGVAVDVTGAQASWRLPREAEEALFRITQEALSNVAKYARASHAKVHVDTTSDTVYLIIQDDGCGFDPARVHEPNRESGWGLMIMRERASAVGAELRIESAPGRGTRVLVTCRSDATLA
jgi:signal transduction histidine kinase